MLQKTSTTSILKSKFENKLIKRPKEDFEKAINAFLQGETGKFGKYVAVSNALVYRTIITSQYGKNQEVGQDIIARRVGSNIIGNSSILPLIGREVSFGNESLNNKVAIVQTLLSDLIPMLPFSVFTEAGLSLNELDIIDRGPEEVVKRKVANPKYKSYDHEKMKKLKIPEFIVEEVHFTGASLFKVEDKLFLFDIDREEIKHKIFNPFLVGIPAQVSTISDAYNALVPEEIKELKDVIRQGEFFYIPVPDSDIKLISPKVKIFGDINKNKDLKRSYEHETFTLQAGRNRPNTAQCGFEYLKQGYVTGRVQHTGREHRDVILKGWYRVVPNTATESFTITGDVD